MDWFVMRHPEIAQPGVVPESAVKQHRDRGWLRVSEAISERNKDLVVLADYADRPDLDPQPAPEATDAPAPVKTSSKEK